MKSSQHVSEEALMELHLQESPGDDGIREHLETCTQCTALSESVAETLRVFSARPVPAVDLEHQWQRLRGSLSPLSLNAKRRRRRLGWFVWVPALACAAVALLMVLTYRPPPLARHERASVTRLGPGPLKNTPLDPQIVEQLDSAERLLTVVNHSSGPLDQVTREQASGLLLKNATYIRAAREEGNPGAAAVLDDLGRVLTNVTHAQDANESGWHLRLEWNTRGLLLDIRMLRQIDSRQ